MRLVNIGLGEIADRLSILALKVAHGTEQGKDISHFVNERNALLTQTRTYELAGCVEWLFELAAVNGMLWQAEDDLREWRGMAHLSHLTIGLDNAQLVDVGKIAFRIQSLNDHRAELVHALNKQAGTDLGQEKL